jgi:nucleotide-binding universal stress UspA family protein
VRLTVRVLVACGALALGACASTVRSQSFPSLAEHPAPRRIAVAPFEVAGSLAEAQTSEAEVSRALYASELVPRQLAEQLAAAGREVVAPEDMAQLLRAEAAAAGGLEPARIARLAADRFGADAVLLGTVHRFRERRGGAAGSFGPASVGFEVTLLSAPGGAKLWRGLFDETQAGLSENVLNALRYPGAGMRWLSAEELSRWGAEEVASALP